MRRYIGSRKNEFWITLMINFFSVPTSKTREIVGCPDVHSAIRPYFHGRSPKRTSRDVYIPPISADNQFVLNVITPTPPPANHRGPKPSDAFTLCRYRGSVPVKRVYCVYYTVVSAARFADGTSRRQWFRRRRQRHGQLDHGGCADRVHAGAVAVRVLAKGHHRAGHRRVHGAHHNRKHTGAGVVHRGPDHQAAEQLLHRVAGRHWHVDRYAPNTGARCCTGNVRTRLANVKNWFREMPVS